MMAKIAILASLAGVTLAADVAATPTPSGGDAGIWLWRGFITLTMLLSGLYLRGLHKELRAASKTAERVESQRLRLERIDRHLRSIVRILAQEAKSYGNRGSDPLVIALYEEIDAEDRIEAEGT